MSLWRIGWTGLLGALAGMVLFPRPARGDVRGDVRGKGVKEGVRAGPAPEARGSAPPSG